MRILLVAVHFPPLNSVAALRPAAWARLLADRGHDVTVLTTRKPRDPANMAAVTHPRIEIVEVPMPFSAFVRSVDRASVTGSGARVSPLARRLSGVLRYLRREIGVFAGARMPDHHDAWVLPALWRVRGMQWDAVISTHGPYACHTIAYWLRRHGRATRWLADFRDLWSDNHIFRGMAPFTYLERWLERRYCRTADVVTTVSDGLAQMLARRVDRSVEVLENGIDLDDLARLSPQRIFPEDDRVRLVYTGTVYETGQTAAPLLHALVRLRATAPDAFARMTVLFVGKTHGKLPEQLAACELADTVELRGMVSRADALRMQRDADALVFLGFDAAAYDGILTGKLFEYLASGTEILSVGVRREPVTAALIEASGRGRDYGDDAVALADTLLRLAVDKGDGKYVRLATRARIDRDASSRRLALLLEDARIPAVSD